MSTLLPEVIAKYKKNDIFLETGSYKGGGIKVALDAEFDLVLSIEINKPYHEICNERFKTEIEDGRVQLYYGDCLSTLHEILPEISEPITFWLDAHIDWECNVSGQTPSPLIYELQLIKELSPNLNHTILIDDMREFDLREGWGRYNPVSKKDIENAILSINPNYKICYEPSSVRADEVLVAYIP